MAARCRRRGDPFRRVDDLLQRFECAALHVAIEKPIERRIALNARFGQHDEVRVFALPLLDRANDPLAVLLSKSPLVVLIWPMVTRISFSNQIVHDVVGAIRAIRCDGGFRCFKNRACAIFLAANLRRGRIMVVQRS
jgi:hypothetical protein